MTEQKKTKTRVKRRRTWSANETILLAELMHAQKEAPKTETEFINAVLGSGKQRGIWRTYGSRESKIQALWSKCQQLQKQAALEFGVAIDYPQLTEAEKITEGLALIFQKRPKSERLGELLEANP